MEELLFDSLVDAVEDLATVDDVLAALGREDWFIVSSLRWLSE